MKFISKLLVLTAINFWLSQLAYAAATAATPSVSVFKTIFGLVVVLGVMAGLAWLAKRMTGRQGYAQSVARIVGGVSVGSRERVVVVEVGDRWLVVGVASGQVNAIANLGKEDGAAIQELTAQPADTSTPAIPGILENGQSFAVWLKKSLNKSGS